MWKVVGNDLVTAVLHQYSALCFVKHSGKNFLIVQRVRPVLLICCYIHNRGDFAFTVIIYLFDTK